MKYILLHGLGQNPSSWNNTVEILERKSDILCPDLSRLLQCREITYPNLYQAFCDYCTEFPEPLSICGLSLGGVLALQYGLEHPQRVRSLVLIGTQYAMPKGLLKLQNIIFRFMPDSAFKETGLGKNDFIGLSGSMMDLDFRKDLNRLSCPVLVICGEKDRANKRASRQLKELLPHAELSILEEAGHEVNRDASERLAGILNSFFNEMGN